MRPREPQRWENKVIASHVAEFEAPAPPQAAQYPPTAQYPHYSPHVHHPYIPPTSQPGQVKPEPVDSRYILNYPSPLPGPTIPALRGPPQPGQPNLMAYARAPQPMPPPQPSRHYPNVTIQHQQAAAAAAGGQQQQQQQTGQAQQQQQPRIPQVDGPSSSGSGTPSPGPPQYLPRASHPSLPQPPQPTESKADDEAINSDLDDSDSEGEEDPEEGGPGETDIVFCTYDKVCLRRVARVKNKWKCILKDGMIHVNGKDYLFAKCTGCVAGCHALEFEW
ncbi:hypothetical protein EVG20_g6164 [Dentipellis fragilis]|uniref:Uncharacterized protein n=1 Tax=Dentipellis fragilis TaxID=205917 RepID=A0A4Y9YPS8_9AGAM|nr:hypothetical protein EVG20_g6164 [Dentipellis fragilis]